MKVIRDELIGSIRGAARKYRFGIIDVEPKTDVLTFKVHFGDNGCGKFSDYFGDLMEFFKDLEELPGVKQVYPIEYMPDLCDDVYELTVKIQTQ